MTDTTAVAPEDLCTQDKQVNLATAQALYEDGEYELAVEHLTFLLDAGQSDRASVLAMLGLAHFKLGA